MKQKERQALIVHLERIPSHRAIERLREAYRQLRKDADGVKSEKPVQEAQNESVGSNICKSVDATARTGSDD
jgi:hypothetical protein